MTAISVGPTDRWTRGDTFTGTLLALGAALISMAAMMRRPDLNFGVQFLFADPGAHLMIAERLGEGARLYRDVGYSYGPLSIYPYAWLAKIAGNTPQTYGAYFAFFSVLNVVLAFRLLRRHVSRTSAALVVVGGLYTTLITPGSLISGGLPSPYFVLERLLFLTALLTWRPPARRTYRHAAAVGVVLGLCQGVRFGTAFFLGAAIVAVDLLALHLAAADRGAVMQWLRASFVTLGSFLAVEAGWALWAFAFLPAPDARDFLWPAYVLEGFAVWPTEYRWPSFQSIRLFVGQQAVMVGCALLGALVIWRAVRDRRPRTSLHEGNRFRLEHGDLVLVIPFAFYLIGAAALFRGVFHFYQYAWTLPFLAALAIDRGGIYTRGAFTLVALPALALVIRANFVTAPPADWVLLQPPRGRTLMVSRDQHRRIEAIRAYATTPVPRSLVIIRTGAGFHMLYGTPFTGRQLFHILGFARRGDAEVMLRTLESEHSAVVLVEYPAGKSPGADPCSWYGWRHFPVDVCPKLAERVDIARAIKVDEATWIIPSRVPAQAGRDVPATDSTPNGKGA